MEAPPQPPQPAVPPAVTAGGGGHYSFNYRLMNLLLNFPFREKPFAYKNRDKHDQEETYSENEVSLNRESLVDKIADN